MRKLPTFVKLLSIGVVCFLPVLGSVNCVTGLDDKKPKYEYKVQVDATNVKEFVRIDPETGDSIFQTTNYDGPTTPFAYFNDQYQNATEHIEGKYTCYHGLIEETGDVWEVKGVDVPYWEVNRTNGTGELIDLMSEHYDRWPDDVGTGKDPGAYMVFVHYIKFEGEHETTVYGICKIEPYYYNYYGEPRIAVAYQEIIDYIGQEGATSDKYAHTVIAHELGHAYNFSGAYSSAFGYDQWHCWDWDCIMNKAVENETGWEPATKFEHDCIEGWSREDHPGHFEELADTVNYKP